MNRKSYATFCGIDLMRKKWRRWRWWSAIRICKNYSSQLATHSTLFLTKQTLLIINHQINYYLTLIPHLSNLCRSRDHLYSSFFQFIDELGQDHQELFHNKWLLCTHELKILLTYTKATKSSACLLKNYLEKTPYH